MLYLSDSPISMQQSHVLEVAPGSWIWGGLVSVLDVDLFSPIWEIRHGTATGHGTL